MNVRRLLRLDSVIDKNYENHKQCDLQGMLKFRSKNVYKTAITNVVQHLIEQEPNQWNDMYARLPLLSCLNQWFLF